MNAPRTRFYLDKQNAKWKGVCAGIADYTGVDVTIVRIGFVIGTLIGQGAPLLAYWVIAWMAPLKPSELYRQDPEQKKFWQGVRRNPHMMAREVRGRLRDIDRRLADMETYVTSSNGRLAREIEQLR
ncbi:MAG: envelope stress response membrane protein PspC [Alphaproteobacteria bacterium]|jgi:phage shock protein C|nr:MAG: envelope stress response membrane protein PspC [Alphaproteobacteria bacterium]